MMMPSSRLEGDLIGSAYPKTHRFVLLTLCAYVLIWFLQLGYRKEFFGDIRIEFCVAAALGAAIFLLRPKPSPQVPVLRKPDLLIYVGALFFCMALSIPFSKDAALSVDVFRDRVIKFAFVSVFLAAFVRSPKDMRYFIFSFLTACAYITQESFRGALNGSMIWENQGVPRLHGDTPLFMHPNSLAGLAIGALPFVFYIYPVIEKKRWRLPLLGLAATSLGCIMYSGSRTAYLALGVFYLYVLMFSRRRFRMIVISCVLGGVLIHYVPAAYKARFATIFTGQDIEGHSMDTRKEILRDAFEIFKKRPFGVGVAAFPAARSEMFGRDQDTHNLYLEVATNLGIHGLIVFLIFIAKLLSSFNGSRRSFESQLAKLEGRMTAPQTKSPALARHVSDLRFLRAVCLAGMGYIVIRLALGLFGMDLYEIYWWIGLGLALALFNIDQISRELTRTLDAAPADAAPILSIQGR